MNTSPGDENTHDAGGRPWNPGNGSGPTGGEQRPEPQYGRYAPQSSSPEPGPERAGAPYNPYAEPSWGREHEQQHRNPEFSGGGAEVPQQPGAGYQAVPPGRRPGPLLAAMWGALITGALALIWGVYTFAVLPTLSHSEVFTDEEWDLLQQQLQNDPQLQDMNAADAVEFVLFSLGVVALIWGVILLGIYIAMAFVGTMAGNPGRVIATIWFGLSVFFLLPIFYFDAISTLLVLATVGLSILCIVLVWLPASSEYVRNRRTFKEWRRYGQQSYRG